MVITKDRPHSPGHSVPMFIVVECEDHSAIQVPLDLRSLYIPRNAASTDAADRAWIRYVTPVSNFRLRLTNTESRWSRSIQTLLKSG